MQTYGKEQLPIFTVIAGGVVKGGHELHFGGQSEHQHSRRAHFNAVPLSDHLRLEFVLRVEVFPGEAPVHRTIRKAGAGLCPDGGGAAWAVYGLVYRLLSGHSAYGANALATLVGILAGVVVYGVLVVALRILRAEDIKALPKGDKITKLLRLK